MKFFFSILLVLFLSNCNKPKTVLICGDHICINKSEAKQYFEDNLSIEVKIIDKKNKKQIDLVELNLKENTKEKRNINILPRNNTKKELKTLSKKEITEIKKNIKSKRNDNQFSKKIIKKEKQEKKSKEKKLKKKKKSENINLEANNVNKKRKDIVDVCTILDKCSIDEISKFLIEQGIKKDFPDITTR